ncbi:MAG: Fe-S cluster assembly protein SufD [Ignavibacteriales bacterium]|nr:Fe-S cluster assembly protein SufD [Ignavibacteriales bacterium]
MAFYEYRTDGMKGQRLVFVNGKYSEKLSDIKVSMTGNRINNLSNVLRSDEAIIQEHLIRYASFEKNSFTALNTGFLEDGAFIHVPDNTKIDEPIYLLFITTDWQSPVISQPHNLIIIGKQSSLSIIEHYINVGKESYLTNTVTEIFVDEDATVNHTKLQTESYNAFHVGSMHVRQKSKSNFTSNSIMIGGSLVRNNVSSILDGEGIECTFNGLSLTAGHQLIDNHTTIDHAKPNCSSHELFKAILDGKSKGVFNGKIYVRKDAQKTDSKQTNKTLLLSDEATMNTKPQLEIFADDVKCTHGAAIGYLDADSIFYLRSRGISEDIARDILTYAFANDIIERITIEPIQRHLHNILYSRFEQARILENT